MEKKLLIQDIAEAIATKSGINKKTSEAFVKALFETIEQGLTEDKFVKIKGLGTFKVIAVGERESVNINTGERFFISGHDKITFTPETSLKDLVNRPFSHFQTVILNEETEIEELESVDDLVENPGNQDETGANASSTEETEVRTNEDNNAGLEEIPPSVSSDLDTPSGEEQHMPNLVEEDSAAGETDEGPSATPIIEDETDDLLPSTEENISKAQEQENVGPTDLPSEYLEESFSTDTKATQEECSSELSISAENGSHTDSASLQEKNQDRFVPGNTEESANDSIVLNKENGNENQSGIETVDSNSSTTTITENNNSLESSENNNEVIVTEESETSEDIEEATEENPLEPKKKNNVWKTVTLGLLAILILLLTYFAGYFKVFCPCEFWNEKKASENIPMILPIPDDSLLSNGNDSIDNDTTNAVTDSISTTQIARGIDEDNEVQTTKINPRKTQEINQNTAIVPVSKQEAQINEVKTNFKQVEGGKYEITGTLRTHKIEKGETIRTIAQEVYGSKGYATYIITYNELVNPNLIDTGTVIKLPKLRKK